jgi:hypothetical protein
MKTPVPGSPSLRKPPRRSAGADRLLRLKLGAARQSARDKKLLDSPSTALALMAEPDDFGEWLIAQAGTLPTDFKLVR